MLIKTLIFINLLYLYIIEIKLKFKIMKTVIFKNENIEVIASMNVENNTFSTETKIFNFKGFIETFKSLGLEVIKTLDHAKIFACLKEIIIADLISNKIAGLKYENISNGGGSFFSLYFTSNQEAKLGMMGTTEALDSFDFNGACYRVAANYGRLGIYYQDEIRNIFTNYRNWCNIDLDYERFNSFKKNK